MYSINASEHNEYDCSIQYVEKSSLSDWCSSDFIAQSVEVFAK